MGGAPQTVSGLVSVIDECAHHPRPGAAAIVVVDHPLVHVTQTVLTQSREILVEDEHRGSFAADRAHALDEPHMPIDRPFDLAMVLASVELHGEWRVRIEYHGVAAMACADVDVHEPMIETLRSSLLQNSIDF